MIARPGLESIATLLAGSLSGGRRRRARLDSGPARAFQTDLRSVAVPLPLPGGESTLRALTCGLVLQASPTKDAVARTGWTALSRRQQRALVWEEGEAAVRWARRTWPGLQPELDRLFEACRGDAAACEAGSETADLDAAVDAAERGAGDAVGALAEVLVRRALERSGDGEPPALFGRLPPPVAAVAGASGRRTFIATRWSNRHRARRSGALPIPVSGPGTEPVLDPGEPGTMEALDGRSGHVRVLELDEPPAAGASAPPRVPLPAMRPSRSLRRGLEAGDVDIDAVVAWRVELAVAGRDAEPRLFCALEPSRDPLAWALLIDASASSSLRGGNVLRRSVVWADALARALTERGERVGVFAFRSHGRERVQVRALKHFDRAYAPLGEDIKPGGYTRLGAALRHAGARVLAEPARAHVLLSLGDAVPYDEGYGEAYGAADVAKAVEELRGRGAHVHHAAMAGRDDAALDAMFGAEGWRPARRVGDLLALVDDVQARVRRG